MQQTLLADNGAQTSVVSGQLSAHTTTLAEKSDEHHAFSVEVFKETIDRLRFLTSRMKLVEEAIGAGYIEGQDVTYAGSTVPDTIWINTQTPATE